MKMDHRVTTHLRTLSAWKAEGRVRYVGVTHYTVESHALLEAFVERGIVDESSAVVIHGAGVDVDEFMPGREPGFF